MLSSKGHIMRALLTVFSVVVVFMGWWMLTLWMSVEPNLIPESATSRVIAGYSVKVSVNNNMDNATHFTVYLTGEEWHRPKGTKLLVSQEMAEIAKELVDDYIVNHPEVIITGYRLVTDPYYSPDDCDALIVSIYHEGKPN